MPMRPCGGFSGGVLAVAEASADLPRLSRDDVRGGWSMSTQKDLSGNELPEHLRGSDHLTMVKPPCPSEETAHADRSEAWCIDCAHRITVGTGEWGHDTSCPHHEQFDAEKQSESKDNDISADADQTTIPQIGGDVGEVDDDE